MVRAEGRGRSLRDGSLAGAVGAAHNTEAVAAGHNSAAGEVDSMPGAVVVADIRRLAYPLEEDSAVAVVAAAGDMLAAAARTPQPNPQGSSTGTD